LKKHFFANIRQVQGLWTLYYSQKDTWATKYVITEFRTFCWIRMKHLFMWG
jgi:hypothetical protein